MWKGLLLAVFLGVLYGCEHYSSNVEVKYKNPDGNLYTASPESAYEAPKKVGDSKTAEALPVAEKPAYSNPNVLSVERDEVQVKKAEGGYHVVQNGETYYSIARLYRISPKDLMVWNDYNGSVLRPGTIISLYKVSPETTVLPEAKSAKLPEAKPLSVASAPPKAMGSAKNLSDSLPKKEAAKPAAAPASGAVSTPASGTVSNIASSPASNKKCGNNSFKSPVKSEGILAKYGDIGSSGVKNDGDLIKVGPKAKVTAAGAGQVVYTGNGFSEYENIVIIKHNDNYFTIYGHLHNILVKKDDTVKSGTVISSVSEKKGYVYFAIRKGKLAINPQFCINI